VTPAPDPDLVSISLETPMVDTSDILIAAGLIGAAYWYSKRRDDDDARVDRYLADATRATHEAPSAPAPTKTGPPSRPIQTAPASAHGSSAPAPPITRTFDPLFAAFGPTLPTAYLRALAAHESNMQPTGINGAGRGLFAVVAIKLQDFNQRHGTHFSLDDLMNPVVNVQVAAGFLRDAVVASYAKNHPDVANLREDWSNPRFVELMTLGWNAGYSELAGVGRVAAFLEHQGRRDITLDLVQANASAAGASPTLADPRRARFCRDVTATYLRERERDAAEGRSTAPPAAPFGPAPLDPTRDAK
jgi:hypothetical protein